MVNHSVLTVMLVALTLFSISNCLGADEIKLPEPQKSGGIPLFEAVAKRSSASGASSAFPQGELSQQELSTLLWATSGLNRPNKWVVPMARGTAPYCSIYVVKKDGCFLYDWKNHSLNQVNTADIRADLSPQGFAGIAPVTFVFVKDQRLLAKVGAPSEKNEEFANILIGAMSQNTYLAAASLNIGGRYAATFKADKLRQHLKLADEETPVGIMPLGKY